MRKAFTLIELMITILISTIFLNFVFRFYNNVLVELRYLETRDSLVYNGFRSLQIIKNGVYGANSSYIGGVITLKSMTGNDNNFTTQNDNRIKLDLDSNNLIMADKTNNISYKINDLNVSNFTINHIKNGLYSIDFNATKRSIFSFSKLNEANITYQRLVYTK